MLTALKLLQALIASPIFLELVRQFLRWVGLTLMTIGIPESLAGLTTSEDTVMGVIGFIMYATSDTGWLVAKYNQFMAWRAKRKGSKR